MSPVNSSCFQRLYDIRAVFLSSFRTIQLFRLFLQDLWIICFKPVSLLSGNPEISSCFPIDPVIQVDPVFDLFRTFPIPGHILRKMAVGFCGIVAETFQHVDPYLLFFPVFLMLFKAFQQFGDHVFSIMLYRNVPGLMIDAGTDDIQFFSGDSQDLCDLHLSMDLSVAQSYSLYSAVFVAGPGCHSVRIGIIQHDSSRLCHFPDILAEIQHFCDHSLAVHNTSGTQSISHTLIHAIFQWDLNVRLKGLQAADPDAVYNISGVFESLSSVCSGKNLYRDTVGVQIPLTQSPGLLQIILIDIRKGNFNVMKFRN